MKAIFPALFAAAISLTTGGDAVASGYHQPAALSLDNHTSDRVDVYIDNAFRGSIHARDDRSFSAWPGTHAILVRDDAGRVLMNERVAVNYGRNNDIDVYGQRGSLLVDNDGRTALWVEVNNRAPFWLSPGQSKRIDIQASVAHLEASAMTSRGLRPVFEKNYDVMGGRTRRADISWAAAPVAANTRFVVNNFENNSIRVFIEGRELASVAAGGSRSFNVSPGRHDVLIIENRGNVLFDDRLQFERNDDLQLRVANNRAIAYEVEGASRPAVARCPTTGRPLAQNPRNSWH